MGDKFKAGDRVVIEAVVIANYLNGYQIRIDGSDKDVVVSSGIDSYAALKIDPAVKATDTPQGGSAPTPG